jgi:hypothetical protein
MALISLSDLKIKKVLISFNMFKASSIIEILIQNVPKYVTILELHHAREAQENVNFLSSGENYIIK